MSEGMKLTEEQLEEIRVRVPYFREKTFFDSSPLGLVSNDLDALLAHIAWQGRVIEQAVDGAEIELDRFGYVCVGSHMEPMTSAVPELAEYLATSART